MKRAWKVLKELAWIVGFCVLVLPAIAKMHAQDTPKHSLRASVRPNDSTKLDPNLPWVSEYTPPPVYEEWWGQIAACEHLPFSLEMTRRVKWVQVNSLSFHVGLQFDTIFGLTDAEHLTIYIAQGSVLEREVIGHEMAHQLDWWNGVDEGEDFHPPDVFKNVCGLHEHHK